MKLSNRLYACAGLVRPGSQAADVGTDHGLLPIYLLTHQICSHVVASDLRPKPLQAARDNARQAGIGDGITFCLSDGLRNVPLTDLDTVICAGMGGDTIQSILLGTPEIWRPDVQFILQPQAAAAELRGFLSDHGFHICREIFAQDGTFVYTIMEVFYGDSLPIPPDQRYIPQGVPDRQSPLYCAYMRRVRNGLEKTIRGLELATAEPNPQRLAYYRASLHAIEGLEDQHADHS